MDLNFKSSHLYGHEFTIWSALLLPSERDSIAKHYPPQEMLNRTQNMKMVIGSTLLLGLKLMAFLARPVAAQAAPNPSLGEGFREWQPPPLSFSLM